MTLQTQLENVDLIDSASILRIRNLVAGDNTAGLLNMSELTERVEISTFKSDVLLNSSVNLVTTAKDASQDDIKNVKLIHNALPNLSSRIATDERLWVTLALGNYYSYAKQRWFDNQPSAVTAKYFVNHILAPSTRSLWRDNAISRLWWVGHYANGLGEDISDRALELFFFNSDLGSQLLGKSSVGTSKPIARAIVNASHDCYIAGKTAVWNRDSFRTFMKEIDLLTGRRILDVVPEAQLFEEVRELFYKCHV
jgi:hypothetical protein